MLLEELISFNRSLQLSPTSTASHQRNRLKEFLHIYLLDFIYKHPIYRNLIFYGGTCLRHCFHLNRLSEDLDFEYLSDTFPLEQFETDLKDYFERQLGYAELSTKRQKFRLYLKLPLLSKLGISGDGASDFLHLKIEVHSTIRATDTFKTEVQPIFSGTRTFFVKRYDLETLMASKIMAVINRTWEKHHKGVNEISDAKGRDYYDLIWYMTRGTKPFIPFTHFGSEKELWEVVTQKVNSLRESSIEMDLIDFLDAPGAARDFASNLKESYRALAARYL